MARRGLSCDVACAESDSDFPIKTIIEHRSKYHKIQATDPQYLSLTKYQFRHNSIVAILTLEVTGIPELSDNREFPWPKPGFIEPTRAFVFEVRTLL
jgi:hypothetical protein